MRNSKAQFHSPPSPQYTYIDMHIHTTKKVPSDKKKKIATSPLEGILTPNILPSLQNDLWSWE